MFLYRYQCTRCVSSWYPWLRKSSLYNAELIFSACSLKIKELLIYTAKSLGVPHIHLHIPQIKIKVIAGKSDFQISFRVSCNVLNLYFIIILYFLKCEFIMSGLFQVYFSPVLVIIYHNQMFNAGCLIPTFCNCQEGTLQWGWSTFHLSCYFCGGEGMHTWRLDFVSPVHCLCLCDVQIIYSLHTWENFLNSINFLLT